MRRKARKPVVGSFPQRLATYSSKVSVLLAIKPLVADFLEGYADRQKRISILWKSCARHAQARVVPAFVRDA